MNADDPCIPAGVALLAVTTILANRHNTVSGASLRTIASIVHSLRTEIPLETPLASNNTRFSQLLRSAHLNSDVAGALRSSWLSQEISKEDVFTPNLYLLSKDDQAEYEELLLHIDAYTITGAFFLNRYDALANVFEFLDKHFPKKKDVHGVGVVADLILGQDWAAAPCSSCTAQRRSIDSRLVAKKTLELFALHQPLRFPEFLSLVADCSMSLDEVSFHGPELCGRVVNAAFHDLDELRSRALTSLYRHNDHRDPTTLRDILKAAVRSLDQEQYTSTSVTSFPKLLQVLVKDDVLLERLGIRVEDSRQPLSDFALQSHSTSDNPLPPRGGGKGVTAEPLRQRLALSLFLILASFPVVAFCNRQRVAMAEDYIQQRSKRRERPSTIFEEYADAFAAAVIKFAPLVFPLDLTNLAHAAAVPSNTFDKIETGTSKHNSTAADRDKVIAAVEHHAITAQRKGGEENHQKPSGESTRAMVAPPRHTGDSVPKHGHETLFPSQLTTDRAVEATLPANANGISREKQQPLCGDGIPQTSESVSSKPKKTFVGSFLDLKEEYAAVMKESSVTHVAPQAVAPHDVVHVSVTASDQPRGPALLNAHERLVRDHIRGATQGGGEAQRATTATVAAKHSLPLAHLSSSSSASSNSKAHLDPLSGNSFATSASGNSSSMNHYHNNNAPLRSSEFSSSLASQSLRSAVDGSTHQQQRSLGSLPSLAGSMSSFPAPTRNASPEEFRNSPYTSVPSKVVPSALPPTRSTLDASPLAHYVPSSHYSSYPHFNETNPLPMYRLDPRSLNVVLPSQGGEGEQRRSTSNTTSSAYTSAAATSSTVRPMLQRVDVNAPMRDVNPYCSEVATAGQQNKFGSYPTGAPSSQRSTSTMNVVLPTTAGIGQQHQQRPTQQVRANSNAPPLEGVVVGASQFLDERRRHEELKELELLLSNARSTRR